METIVIEIEKDGANDILNFQFENNNGEQWDAKLTDSSRRLIKSFNCAIIIDCLESLSQLLPTFGKISRIFALKPDCNYVPILKSLIAGNSTKF